MRLKGGAVDRKGAPHFEIVVHPVLTLLRTG
jgi:hypothetical protein